MRWLETSGDDVERRLRRALDEASQRTGDEIARRRIWTRIAEPSEEPRSPRFVVQIAIAATLVSAVAGAALVWPPGRHAVVPPASVTERPPAPPVAPDERFGAPERQRLDRPGRLQTGPRERAWVTLPGGAEVDLEPNTTLVLDARLRAAVDHGRVTLAVPHQAPGHSFTMSAGPYVIAVLGTRFHVRVAGESVGVDVEEGVVEVRRAGRATRVPAGESWTSPFQAPAVERKTVTTTAGVTPLVAPPPVQVAAVSPVAVPVPRPSAMDQFREAQVALAHGHPQRALELLEGLAQGSGPAAENAAYEIGRVLRDPLRRPRDAIAAWNRYRARFPRGILRAEADISVLETLVAQGETAGARTEAQGFLGRHPESERRSEVAELLERLR